MVIVLRMENVNASIIIYKKLLQVKLMNRKTAINILEVIASIK